MNTELERIQNYSIGMVAVTVLSMAAFALALRYQVSPYILLTVAPFGQLISGYLWGRRDEIRARSKGKK